MIFSYAKPFAYKDMVFFQKGKKNKPNGLYFTGLFGFDIKIRLLNNVLPS